MTMILRALLVTAAVAFAAPAVAQSAASGAEKAKQVCAACHGPDGNGVAAFPDYPKIAGQQADYLAKALRDYKSGTRKNAIMAAQAQGLSSKEIRDLAAYFASQQGTLHVKR
jgi:cytochrome c553